MASSDKKYPVRITADDGGAEIIVIDASFSKVNSAIGALGLDLSPGIYKVRFKVGNRSADEVFEVQDRPVTIHRSRLGFASPIPLPGTVTNHEYHYYPSRQIALQPPMRLGTGGELFIFVRDSLHDENAPCLGTLPWDSMRVYGLRKEPLVSLGIQGQVSIAAGYAGVKVALNPGAYLIAADDHPRPGSAVELPVAVCSDWCTHVYIDAPGVMADKAAPSSSGNIKPLAVDLGGASVVMVRISDGSTINDDVGRLSEVARQAFLLGRNAVPPSDLDAMVADKAHFPMLGLFAAHLLVAHGSSKETEVRQIVGNLSRWLGSGHPDVRVLQRAIGMPGIQPSEIDLWPPMLSATWVLGRGRQLLHPTLEQLYGQYHLANGMWGVLQRPSAARTGAVTAAPRPSPSLATDVTERLVQPLDSWRKLSRALRKPLTTHTPFQQALRRTILDALEDSTHGAVDVGRLARQFRISLDVARQEYADLEAAARGEPPDQ